MSLWTPYAEAPLDLSKVKEERHSPPVHPVPEIPAITSVDYYSTGYHQPYYSPPIQEIAQPVPYYPYQYPYGVPSAQMSPVSAESSCSYEVRSPVEYRPPTLSPPESPPSVKPRNYVAEAEVLSDDPDFQAFERDALRAMAEKNGGTLLGNNPRMRRAVQTTQAVDDSYRKQRERNNFAAKQSRDRRKLREIHLALKVAYLKNEVTKLKAQLSVTTCTGCRRFCDS
ncbi:basic region leucine zipper domain-containing protein [Phthorimaea operculella]|nr:basic region leucine zipper domain-containing protein [Phthorimaea operculella]